MMTSAQHAILTELVYDTCDYFELIGVDISHIIKRRDPDETGRRVKETLEAELFPIVMRYFRRQKRDLRIYLQQQFPDRKVEVISSLGELFQDDRFHAELLLWLTKAAESGVLLFELDIGFGVPEAANFAAADWARAHASELIEQLTSTQRNTIQRAVSAFVETPGMTIGDIVNDLVGPKMFGEDRAMRIAVSEVTNSFSQADRIAGEALQTDFPDVPVFKRWHTNNDGLVCPRCAPLHLQEVRINEQFVNAPLGLTFDGPPGHPANCRCWRSTRTRISEAI